MKFTGVLLIFDVKPAKTVSAALYSYARVDVEVHKGEGGRILGQAVYFENQ